MNETIFTQCSYKPFGQRHLSDCNSLLLSVKAFGFLTLAKILETVTSTVCCNRLSKGHKEELSISFPLVYRNCPGNELLIHGYIHFVFLAVVQKLFAFFCNFPVWSTLFRVFLIVTHPSMNQIHAHLSFQAQSGLPRFMVQLGVVLEKRNKADVGGEKEMYPTPSMQFPVVLYFYILSKASGSILCFKILIFAW